MSILFLDNIFMALSPIFAPEFQFLVSAFGWVLCWMRWTWQFPLTLKVWQKLLYMYEMRIQYINTLHGNFSDKCTKIYLYWSYTCLHTFKICTIHYFFYITIVKDQTFAFCGLWGQTEIFIFKMVQKLYLSQLNLQPKKLCLACLAAI